MTATVIITTAIKSLKTKINQPFTIRNFYCVCFQNTLILHFFCSNPFNLLHYEKHIFRMHLRPVFSKFFVFQTSVLLCATPATPLGK